MDEIIKIGGDQVAYVATLQYLHKAGRPVSPHELALALGKSRVTVQSVLKRLMQNGWAIKEGKSPKVTYRAVDPFAKERPVPKEEIPTDRHSVDAFIAWCRQHGYHVPEIALEYQRHLKLQGT